MTATTRERMGAMWRDYERYGGPADPTRGQPTSGRWSHAFCLVQHFGRLPWLIGSAAQAAGGMGWDPCLPEPGTPDYAIIESFVLAAERVIAEHPRHETEQRLWGYAHGHRVPSGLNAGWANPLNVIDGSEELRAGLVEKLKEAALASTEADDLAMR